jgi:hypothetical protein
MLELIENFFYNYILLIILGLSLSGNILSRFPLIHWKILGYLIIVLSFASIVIGATKLKCVKR